MIREAIILAGGFGTRLQGVIGKDIPKPMAPVSGRPFLEYLLAYLNKAGVSRIILASGYKHEVIENHFGNSFMGMAIKHSVEKSPLGTGGAVKQAIKFAEGTNVLVVNGDTFFDVNLHKLENFFRSNEADVCIALRKVGDVSRYGKVEIDLKNRILGFQEKGAASGMGFINGGTYIISRKAFMKLDLPEVFSLEKDYFEKYYTKQQMFGVRCFSYFLDIGIPEDYEEAQHAFEGLIIE